MRGGGQPLRRQVRVRGEGAGALERGGGGRVAEPVAVRLGDAASSAARSARSRRTPARCQTCAGAAGSDAARSAWAARCRASGVASSTALRSSGCRARTGRRAHQDARVRASSRRPPSPRPRLRHGRDAGPPRCPSASRSTARQASGDSRSTARGRGRGAGRPPAAGTGAAPPRPLRVRPAPGPPRAARAGCPPVSPTSRSRTGAASRRAGGRASAAEAPGRGAPGSPARGPGDRVVWVITNADRVGPSRRAAKARADADSRSSHCRSSTSTSTGPRSAAAASRDRVAAPTRKRSADAVGGRPAERGRERLPPGAAGTSPTRSRIGFSRLSSPAWASWYLRLAPRRSQTGEAGGAATGGRQQRGFPIPGSPSIRSTSVGPPAASASSASIRASSAVRPSTPGLQGVMPDATEGVPGATFDRRRIDRRRP